VQTQTPLRLAVVAVERKRRFGSARRQYQRQELRQQSQQIAVLVAVTVALARRTLPLSPPPLPLPPLPLAPPLAPPPTLTCPTHHQWMRAKRTTRRSLLWTVY
jgi:hypothetical protein